MGRHVLCGGLLGLVLWLGAGAATAGANVWRVQPTPLPAAGATSPVLKGVSCRRPSTCVAVGSYVNASSATVTLAERWNGTRWSVQPTPNPSGPTSSVLAGVSCTAATACMAVGSYSDGSGATLPLAESWNGTSWVLEPPVNPAGSTFSPLNAVSCTDAGACTAVGEASSGSTLAERWNGTSWSVQSTPNITGTFGDSVPNSLSGVSCWAANGCEAVGSFTDTDLNADVCPIAMRWNGAIWTSQRADCPGTNPQAMMGPDAIFASVSCSSATHCSAVGNYLDLGNQYTLAETLTAGGFTTQTTPNQPGSFGSVVPNLLTGASCPTSGACEAVGSFTDTDVNSDVCPVAMGSSAGVWTSQSPRCPGSNPAAMMGSNALFNGVSCTAEVECTAVGSFFETSRQRALVERYTHSRRAVGRRR